MCRAAGAGGAVSDHDYLPAVLAEIAEVAGIAAALAIADARGGTRVHFPARAPDEHWLPRLVGREAADKLCAHFRVTMSGGVTVLVPLGPKNFYKRARRRAGEMFAKGSSNAEVAKAIGVHCRSIERYRARERDVRGSDQGRLF